MPRAMPTNFAETSPRTSSPATTMESVSPTCTFNLRCENYIATLILLDLMEVKAYAFSIHPADQEFHHGASTHCKERDGIIPIFFRHAYALQYELVCAIFQKTIKGSSGQPLTSS